MYDRHPDSIRFHQLLEQAGDTHDAKQLDYGSEEDPFANVRESEQLGIPGWVGAVLRNNDKSVRLRKAARDTITFGEPHLSNEGVLDTLMDQAVYALIAYVLYEEWDRAREAAFEDMRQDGIDYHADVNGWVEFIHPVVEEDTELTWLLNQLYPVAQDPPFEPQLTEWNPWGRDRVQTIDEAHSWQTIEGACPSYEEWLASGRPV